MKEDKEIEKILLNDESYEKFIHSKTEKEFNNILTKSKNNERKEITDIKQVPKELLFSKHTIYTVINKDSKTQSHINGIQAEGYLGAQELVREKFMSGQTDYFVSGSNYIKFLKTRI
ncbi:hypothetical protein IJ596_02590 [bacterium]|nr:hypothetical protein [bacterium]